MAVRVAVGFLAASLTVMYAAASARADHATTGRWQGPFLMGRLSATTVDAVRATHVAVLRRQTAVGDSTLIVHWHESNKMRLWPYSSSASGTTFSFDSTQAFMLVPPTQNEFCAGHVSLHDGRLLVAGGTAPTVQTEVGTNEVATFDPNRPDLWTASSHWVSQDTMKYDRWYPVLTQLGDGTVLANSGVEYFEMMTLGGESPADSAGPLRAFRGLGLSRFPAWQSEPMNLDAPAATHPRLRDHTSILTDRQQKRSDGRGVVVTFGGVDETGHASDRTYWTWDVAVDPHNSWRTETFPLASGSPTPPARSQHAAGVAGLASDLGSYELRMYVYGGRDDAGNALGDVWYLRKPDNTSTGGTWQQLTPSGPGPGPRYGHTMIFDPGPEPGSAGFGLPTMFYPKLFLFGGKRSPGVWAGTDTVFVLQLWDNTWYPLVLGGTTPAPRYRHAAVIDRVLGPGETRVRMFLQGGAGSNGSLLNDTWTLSRSTTDAAYATWAWSSDPASASLPASYKHALVHDEQWNRLTLFGGDRTYEGTGGESNSGGESNETWVRATDVFVTDTTWKPLATSAPIVRRSGHSAVYLWNKSVNSRIPERFSPLAAVGQRWNPLTASPKFDRQTFPLVFGLPDGRVFYAGRNDSSAMLPASLTGVWADKKLAAPSAATLTAATGVEYLPGRVLKVGGRADQTGAAAVRAEFASGSHQWITASTTNLKARGNPNATVLPNGQVLVTGGRQADLGQDGSNGATPVHVPQAWTPFPIDTWTPSDPIDQARYASEPVNRGYHSTAILLPDARVLSAGGEEGPSPALDDAYLHGTIFEPPYLFDPASPGGNSYIARPTIDAAPALIAHGCPFQITATASGGVSSMCLIRPGAVTHAFNQDQHFIPLSFTQSGSVVTADGPADAYTAPPGDYMLFVLDNTSRRVPSVARWVRVTESIGPYQTDDAIRPGRVLNLQGSSGLDGPGCAQPVHVTWTSPSDDSNVTASGRVRALDLRYSTSTICDNCWSAFASATQVDCEPPAAPPAQSQSMDIAGLGIGSYHFRLMSRDDQGATGNHSALSNGRTVSVFGCEEAFSGGGSGGGSGFSARAAGSPSALGETPGAGLENSLRLPATGVGTDRLRLASVGLEGGLLRAHLRRGLSGETRVQGAALVVLDHPADREVVHVAGGWRIASRAPAVSARGDDGEDVSALLNGTADEWLVGDTGDTLTLQLAPDPGAVGAGVLYLEAHAGRIAGVDDPGLRILHQGADGGWLEAGRVLPRSRFSTSLVEGIAGDVVRIVFEGNHAIRSIGRMLLEGSPVENRSDPVLVAHSTSGTVDPVALTEGGVGILIGTQERLDLGFTPPAETPMQARSYFLEVSGTSSGGDAVAARARTNGEGAGLPVAFQFGAPMPNPTRSEASLRLAMPQGGRVRADVYDLLGRRIVTLAAGSYPAGWHTLVWDGRTKSGARAAAGVYLIRITAANRTFDRRLVVMP